MIFPYKQKFLTGEVPEIKLIGYLYIYIFLIILVDSWSVYYIGPLNFFSILLNNQTTVKSS